MQSEKPQTISSARVENEFKDKYEEEKLTYWFPTAVFTHCFYIYTVFNFIKYTFIRNSKAYFFLVIKLCCLSLKKCQQLLVETTFADATAKSTQQQNSLYATTASTCASRAV